MDNLNADSLKSLITEMREQRPKMPKENLSNKDSQNSESLSQQISNLGKGARKRSIEQLLGGIQQTSDADKKIDDDPIYLDASIRKNLGKLVKTLIEVDKKKQLEMILNEHHKFIGDILTLLATKSDKELHKRNPGK